jgi:pimeloyl-ACP methyl ester carboxylesterase
MVRNIGYMRLNRGFVSNLSRKTRKINSQQLALQYPNEVSGIVLVAPAANPERGGFSFQNLLMHIPVLSSIMIKALSPYIHNEIKCGLERAFAPAPVPKKYLKLALSGWAGSSAIRATIADHQARQHHLREISSRYPTIHYQS